MSAATAEVIKQLVPFGIIGLAIVAIVAIAVSPGSKTNLRLAFGAIVAIGLLAVVDKLTAPKQLQPAPPTAAPAVAASGAGGGMLWVDTGLSADWVGNDAASSTGPIPIYKVQDMTLCDENRPGFVSVCWDNRPSGFPPGVPTDISGAPRQWCTYKDSRVKLYTPPNGSAIPSHVFVCGRSIPRT